MKNILFQGNIIEQRKVVDVEDRSYQFGDGIYEVIGVYDGKPMLLDEHLERLRRSASAIQLTLPMALSSLKSKLLELAELNGLREGIIYLQVSRGVAPRWHEFPAPDVDPVCLAYTREEQRMTDIEDNGAKAILTEDIRWLRCDIKTLNLLPNVLAKQKAVEHDAIEAIFHRGKVITEASSSNVFIVNDGQLFTHPANNYILNGITRQKVFQLSDRLQIPVNEKTFTLNDLLAADEVFITATKLDIVPIIKVDDDRIGDGLPGSVTKRIIEQFRLDVKHLTKNQCLHR
ncbi:MAG TPA: D-amino-acid transaminase [Bacillota bacterium]